MQSNSACFSLILEVEEEDDDDEFASVQIGKLRLFSRRCFD